jgi:hypothetical protein
MSRLLPLGGMAIAAVLLLAPSLLLGTLPSNSAPQNITWATQFAQQFGAGVPYPRWMPLSFDGLGSPAFYFYPPLPYWLDGLLDVVTLHRIAVEYRLSIGFAALLWLSGAGMHAFLRTLPITRLAAMIGALAYMAAPYHLFDHYIRGALAEFAAYAMVPFVALGIRWAAMRHRFGVELLAVAYGALILCHLPTALLVSISLVPAYVAWSAWTGLRGERLAAIGTSALGLAWGAALAALYLVPALGLQAFISAEQLWTPAYQADNWLLLLPPTAFGRPTEVMVTIDCIAGAAAVALAGVVLFARGRREAVFWAVLALGVIALMAGVVPGFWRVVPLVSKVQFPWRFLVVVEFATVVALCLYPWQDARRPARLVFLAAVLALIPAFARIGGGTIGRIDIGARGEAPPPQDVKEYLPAGYPQRANGRYDDLGLEPLKDIPLVACAPAAERCEAAERRFGELAIRVTSDRPVVVTVRRFYFPAWRLEPATPLAATDPYRLVSFTSAAGEQRYSLRRGATAEEIAGAVVSLLALLALVGRAIAARRSSRPA